MTRWPCCWSFNTIEYFFSKNLHENGVKLPEERNAFGLDHQRGRRDQELLIKELAQYFCACAVNAIRALSRIITTRNHNSLNPACTLTKWSSQPFFCSPWSSHVWPRQLEPYETNVISELLRPPCGKLEQWAGFCHSDTHYIRLGYARYVWAIRGQIKLHCGTLLGDEFWLTLPCNLWGCVRDRVEMVVKVHCVPECTLTAILTRSLAKPQSGE